MSGVATQRAIESIKLFEDVSEDELALKDRTDVLSALDQIVGSSAALWRALTHVSSVARTDRTVLIKGEAGTGKGLIARAIHEGSSRSSRSFVRVNCAALPASLITAELFGHEKAAFTGAGERRVGRFELAHGGTIFLDDIGDLSAETQVVLLRVLQEGQFERVGGTRPISVDVRVVAATHRNLLSEVHSGNFRADLFHRLDVFPIEVPALRERTEDIPALVDYFIAHFARKAGKRIRKLQPHALKLLRRYRWPGNIRELRNVIERAVILSDDETLCFDEIRLQNRTPYLSVVPVAEARMINAARAQRLEPT